MVNGENAGYLHVLLFLTILSKVIFVKIVKCWDCMVKG